MVVKIASKIYDDIIFDSYKISAIVIPYIKTITYLHNYIGNYVNHSKLRFFYRLLKIVWWSHSIRLLTNSAWASLESLCLGRGTFE